MRNGGAAHKNIEAPRSIYGVMPEKRKWIEIFRLRVPNIACLVVINKHFLLTLEMTIRESFLDPSHKSPVTPNPQSLIPSY